MPTAKPHHERIRRIAGSVEDVEGVDELRVRRSGLVCFVDIHVEVDGGITVERGHSIGHGVKDRLLECELPILDVLVHVEPLQPAGVDSLPKARAT